MSRQVIAFLDSALSGGRRAALVTLTESGESSPGVAGGMMAVLEDGSSCGTVGGGAVEAEVQRRCAEAIRGGKEFFEFELSLKEGDELGMICGGEVKGFARVFQNENRLFVFGGGHVGRKLAEVGYASGFSVIVVDNRELEPADFPPSKLENADFGAYASALEAGGGCYAVIVTRGHAFDYHVLRAIAEKPFRYIGMIGSRQKVAATFARLREDGVAEEHIEKIYAPVGLDIDDGSPGEIAVAILAEILMVKNGCTARSCRDK